VFGIELQADLQHAVPGALLVANHISWIDVFAVNALLPAAFIAKEEVRHWPLFGWLARKNDTIFLRRGSRGHAKIIHQEIADILEQGQYVAVFPEGTTTDGTHLLHFHGALIQPALAIGRPVVPVAISYWETDGTRSLAPRYDGDISLGQCTRALLGRRQLIARVSAMPALGLNGEDRREVALAARQAIALAASLTVAPEI
jgi:1-acyl-sn-glycerol-3-phosphate acyltransferase